MAVDDSTDLHHSYHPADENIAVVNVVEPELVSVQTSAIYSMHESPPMMSTETTGVAEWACGGGVSVKQCSSDGDDCNVARYHGTIPRHRGTIFLRYQYRRLYGTFYSRDAMLARVFATATCLSVCPSVTGRYCA